MIMPPAPECAPALPAVVGLPPLVEPALEPPWPPPAGEPALPPLLTPAVPLPVAPPPAAAPPLPPAFSEPEEHANTTAPSSKGPINRLMTESLAHSHRAAFVALPTFPNASHRCYAASAESSGSRRLQKPYNTRADRSTRTVSVWPC